MSSFRIVLVIALLATACASGNGSESEVGSRVADAMVDAGREIYRASCAVCHGVDLTGSGTGPSLLSEVYAPDQYSDVAFTQAVGQGSPEHLWTFGPMPPIEGLSGGDIEAIVAYVRENQRTTGFEPYPPE